MSDRIHGNFRSFTTFFAGASTDAVTLDSKALHFREFADLAEAANRMIEKRKEAEDALKESRAWLRTILDSILSGVFVIDTQDNRIVDLNDAALTLIGANREEVLGHCCHDFICEAEKDACPILNDDMEVYQEEKRLNRKTGGNLPILKSCSRLRTGGKDYIVASFLNLSEQKRLEAQLRQAHKIEALGLLAGGVAHDLNNMLSPIIGFGEILLSEYTDEDPHRGHVRKMLDAGMKARDLVHQLLAFGRKQALEIKTIDINRLIQGLEKLLRRTIPEDIVMEFLLDPGSPLVKADAGQLEQVIMNLILNARDAMPNGGKLTLDTRRVELEVQNESDPGNLSPGAYVQLIIADTGMGMDADTRGRIFDPFFTTKEKGKGTGLGLAMVYGIIKQHGGSIHVTSEPGKGTRFVIHLPIAEDDAAVAKAPAARAEVTGGNETILVVEDNDIVRDLATTILGSLGVPGAGGLGRFPMPGYPGASPGTAAPRAHGRDHARRQRQGAVRANQKRLRQRPGSFHVRLYRSCDRPPRRS